jgi:hypothetical protein
MFLQFHVNMPLNAVYLHYLDAVILYLQHRENPLMDVVSRYLRSSWIESTNHSIVAFSHCYLQAKTPYCRHFNSGS